MNEFLDWLREWRQNHVLQGLLLTLVGVVVGWLLGRWRRHRLLRQIHSGSAREVVAVEQVLVKDHPGGPTTLRIRACGAAPVKAVLVNPVAHDAFLARTEATKPTNPLLALHDQMGSYLLYLLTPWVCGLARGGRFAHDVWVMAPVCEPGLLSAHQSATIILVRRDDLRRFLDWEACQPMHVEHSSDGARILTLWHMAREFERQLAEVKRLREAGKRTTYAETMYLLDLALDTDEAALPTKPVPWDRYDSVLKTLGLS